MQQQATFSSDQLGAWLIRAPDFSACVALAGLHWRVKHWDARDAPPYADWPTGHKPNTNKTKGKL